MSMIIALVLSTLASAPSPDAEGWIPLFNGKDLGGWTTKVVGHPLDTDPYKTVRVEDGMIRIDYDNYEGEFDGRFLHLFHVQPFSRYRLRVEYRFHGAQAKGGPGWAWRNSGAMLHCQHPGSMSLHQEFPVSIEGQFLGGDGTNPRTTGNLCTPGTNVVLDGKLDTRHCINSNSKTMHGDQWVTAEFEVDGNGTIRHFINGEQVMEYEQPQLDPTDPDAQAIVTGAPLDRGWIALQGESHPVDFRKVDIKPLDGLHVIGGPLLGDLRSDGVRLWFQVDHPGPVSIDVVDQTDNTTRHLTFLASTEREGSIIVPLNGLKPGTKYRVNITDELNTHTEFTTLPEGSGQHARIAFGSCAKEAPGSASVWKRMLQENLTALVLLGDTPYIDTTDLATQRRRYREFAMADGFRDLAATVPVYSTWDDHDIGRNDTDGRLDGKANSRQAFMEHRPNPSFGVGDEGIFTSFRQGPVELFILDTRWFARTEGGEDDFTLLGDTQWTWLEQGLMASDAPFTVLCNGMVFNNSVRPGKTDCWGAYPKEYERLIDLLERVGTKNVLLVSGDVHWSRSIAHPTSDRLGYDLIECTTSPIHEHLIKAADAPHDGLRWSRGEINSFLVVDVRTDPDGADVLTASFRNAAGAILHEEEYRVND
jgi:hypothetical protein